MNWTAREIKDRDVFRKEGLRNPSPGDFFHHTGRRDPNQEISKVRKFNETASNQLGKCSGDGALPDAPRILFINKHFEV